MKNVVIVLQSVVIAALIVTLFSERSTERPKATSQKSDAPTTPGLTTPAATKATEPVSPRSSTGENSKLSSATGSDEAIEVYSKPAFLKAFPEYEAINNRRMRREMCARYGDLSSLNLPPEVVGALRNLIAESYNNSFDTLSILREKGLKPDSPQYQEAYRKAREDMDRSFKELMGEDRFKQLQRLPAVEKYRDELRKSQMDFEEARAPLNADQSQRLAELMASTLEPASTNLESHVADASTGLHASQSELLARAKEFLSPDQIAVLEIRYKDDNWLQAMWNAHPKLKIVP